MSIGIVSDAEIQDATPAAMFAHTRRRSDNKNYYRATFFAQPDIVLDGGSAYFLPSPTPS